MYKLQDMVSLCVFQNYLAKCKNCIAMNIFIFNYSLVYWNYWIVTWLKHRPEELRGHLRRFYAETQPKLLLSRITKMTAEKAQEYHKNSLKNVHTAINRYLKDNIKDTDTVKDK